MPSNDTSVRAPSPVHTTSSVRAVGVRQPEDGGKLIASDGTTGELRNPVRGGSASRMRVEGAAGGHSAGR